MTLAMVTCPVKLLVAASTLESFASGQTKLSFSIA